MNRLRVWNKSSTNYGQNKFAIENGTGCYGAETIGIALGMMEEAVCDENVTKAILEIENGTLVWEKKCRENEDGCCHCDPEDQHPHHEECLDEDWPTCSDDELEGYDD